MKTLISTIILVFCFLFGEAQSIPSRISTYDSTVNSQITNSNSHTQQITQTIVGNSFTNLSAIVLGLTDSLNTTPKVYNLIYNVGHDSNSGDTVTINSLIGATVLRINVGNHAVDSFYFNSVTGKFGFNSINGVYDIKLSILYKL